MEKKPLVGRSMPPRSRGHQIEGRALGQLTEVHLTPLLEPLPRPDPQGLLRRLGVAVHAAERGRRPTPFSDRLYRLRRPAKNL